MANYEELREAWLQEEQARFEGWDFSHLEGRCKHQPVPWNYQLELRRYLTPQTNLLDMGTGGGEFLLSLGHPHPLTSVTEGYPPNLRLCRERLSPLGVDVREVGEDGVLPFSDASFDLVINRHEEFDAAEVLRVLRPGGVFITQQVGGSNNLDLASKITGPRDTLFPGHDLDGNRAILEQAGFHVLAGEEAFLRVEYYDVGALVYFAKVIPWEFPDFSVERCFENLCACQRELEEQGCVAATEHRFLLAGRKG